jgi:flagellar assembly protein FliH
MNLSTDPAPHKNTPAGADKSKFLFDLSFDADVMAGARGDATLADPQLTLLTSEVDAMKAEAYAAGVAAGQQEAADSQQAQMNAMLDILGSKLQTLAHNVTQHSAARDEAMANAIKAIAHKLLPAYAAQNGLAEIENIVSQTITGLRDEPRLVIRVAEAHADGCSTRLPALAKSVAWPGQLIIMADATLGPSDCRLEWADGGLERLENSLWAEVDRLLGKYTAYTGANARAAMTAEYKTKPETPAEGGLNVNE